MVCDTTVANVRWIFVQEYFYIKHMQHSFVDFVAVDLILAFSCAADTDIFT